MSSEPFDALRALIEKCKQYEHKLPVTANEMMRDIGALAENTEFLLRDYIELKWRHNTMAEGVSGNYWLWQGDGEDHLESLTCPVLIPAAELKYMVDRLRFHGE